jgi:microcin C transport system substrate-binding protein
MRPEARFSDGTPLTAHDVVFTHNLFLEQGLPSYAEAVGYRVINAEALDDHTVRFEFREGISRRSLIDQVGGTPVFSQAWYEETGARLDESRLETSPGSGPYVLDGFEINRRITYRRNPDYWGWHLPNNQGRHNFDVVRVEYFADDTAAFEAFKTGEYTFRAEGNSRQWAVGYDFPAVARGHVVRAEIPDGMPPPPPASSSTWRARCSRTARARGDLAGVQFRMDQPAAPARADVAAQSFSQGTRLEAEGVPEGRSWSFCSLGDMVPKPRS